MKAKSGMESASATKAAEDSRGARQLTAAENADLCSGCVKCCTYITVEIDAPRAPWEYDQWVWALHHRGVNLYVEKPERWFLHFETVCRQLNGEGRCSIYGRHPVLCREYDPRTCERRLPLGDIRAWFHDADEFERWLQAERPRHWERLAEFRRQGATGEPRAGPPPPALLTISGLEPRPHGRLAKVTGTMEPRA
jgi:Fe-S-cluster containining protein